ncbi:hypothetical protein CIRG_00204 [Coccidioides immitis RMSCC 2394]|uniref:Uncharacterized protein n=1 Tax=Coccidioides immitis RMSCC 2394 TaxID=404692 RepID=A0A0J7AS65_COCIT|nr:hypothetical protein CIRG_00204 [Coccidioides immitis RMSCC 2394]
MGPAWNISRVQLLRLNATKFAGIGRSTKSAYEKARRETLASARVLKSDVICSSKAATFRKFSKLSARRSKINPKDGSPGKIKSETKLPRSSLAENGEEYPADLRIPSNRARNVRCYIQWKNMPCRQPKKSAPMANVVPFAIYRPADPTGGRFQPVWIANWTLATVHEHEHEPPLTTF